MSNTTPDPTAAGPPPSGKRETRTLLAIAWLLVLTGAAIMASNACWVWGLGAWSVGFVLQAFGYRRHRLHGGSSAVNFLRKSKI